MASTSVVYASNVGCKANDKRFDNASAIISSLEPGTCFVHDLYGSLYSSPIHVPDGCRIVGMPGGLGNADGGSQVRPFDPEQPHIFSIGGPDETNGGPVIERIQFRKGTDKCDAIVVAGAMGWVVRHCFFQFYKRAVNSGAAGGNQSGLIESNRFDRNGTDILVHNDGLGSDASTACLRIASNDHKLSQIGIDLAVPTRQCVVEANTLHAQKLAGIVVRSGRVVLIANYVETMRVNRVKIPSLAVMSGAAVKLVGGQYNGLWAESALIAADLLAQRAADRTIHYSWGSGDAVFTDKLPIPHNELPREVQ